MHPLSCLLFVLAVLGQQGACQVQPDTLVNATNPAPNALFGSSVATYGDTLVVGSFGESFNGTGVNGETQFNNVSAAYSGAAYVFVKTNSTWSQQAYLKPSNTGAYQYFGISVAIYDNTIVVGAFGESSSAQSVDGDQQSTDSPQAGAVYVFSRSGTTWSQDAYLKASNSEAGDSFGFSVSIFGDRLVVGAYLESSNATGIDGDQQNNFAPQSGAAYVFFRNGTTWFQQAYLKANNTAMGETFGRSVSINNNSILVGAPSAGTGSPNYGGAYVFVWNDNTWSQQAHLKASSPGLGSQFGYSVAIDGGIAVVGAPYPPLPLNTALSTKGAVYVFLRSGDTWYEQPFTPIFFMSSDLFESNRFGWSVSVHEQSILVGAIGENYDSGAVYSFLVNAANIKQGPSITAFSIPNEHFGTSVAISDQFYVIGAPGESQGYGAAYIGQVSPIAPETSSEESNQEPSQQESSQEASTAEESSGGRVSSQEESSESSEEPGQSSVVIVVILLVVFLLVIVMVAAVVLFWRRRRRKDSGVSDVKLKKLHHKIDILEHITMKEVIGKGAFGEVYLGDCNGTPCACKTLSNSDMDEAIKEASMIFKLSHPNIVRLIGIYFSPSNEAYLVLQYVKGGSLNHFLPKKRTELTVNQLVAISIGVAQGMAYLERKEIVHRDLAARNILINENSLEPIISDFGMSRDNLYQRSSSSKIPVKWSAPEVLQQGASTSKADVFSFGVVLWEIFSFAVMPFSDLSNDEAVTVICNEAIKEKLRKPEACPDELYQWMVRCWSFDPSDRPTFQVVLTGLQSIIATMPEEVAAPASLSSPDEAHYN